MAEKQRNRKELGFFEHLDELRNRIIRCVIYIVVGSIAGWTYREPLLVLLRRPAEIGAQQVGVEHLPFRVFEPVGGFMIAIQVALMTGLVAAAPLLIWEIWRFVEPALEHHERRYSILVLPFAIMLFLGGVVFCYFVSPRAFAFLFSIDLTLGVELERTLQPYLWFMMRLMLAFGLAFELPLVLMFLGFIGVVDSRQLIRWWRQAVVIVFIFAAVVTPTMDPVNMTILAVPMMLLYLLSIVLVRFVQRKRERETAAPAEDFDVGQAEGVTQDDPYESAERETEQFYAEANADAPEAEAEEPPDDDDLLEAEPEDTDEQPLDP